MSEIVKQEKAKRAKWNTDIVDGLSAEYGFEVWKCSETHFRLFHPKRGPLNYWPSTNKANWDKGESFDIPDIEAYLMKHFNPITKESAESRANRYEKALKEIQEEITKAEKESIFVDEFKIRKILANALTPKTSTDEQA